MDSQLINELKQTSFELWSHTPLRTLAERIRNIVVDHEEVDAVVRCEQCGKLYGLKPHVEGLWCACGVQNPRVNPQWVGREATVSDDVAAQEFLVGRMLAELKKVVGEFETVANDIGHLKELIGKIQEKGNLAR